jgi:NitT/TauT family transport system permease protein/sulfonate transport system permease protein
MGKIAKTLQIIFPLVCFFLIWQIFSAVGILNSQFLPSPVEIIKRMFELLSQNSFAVDILQSIKRVFVGFALAGIFGISLGIVCGMYKPIYSFLNPIIELFRPIPPIAWIPLAILWFGLGDNPAFFLVFLGAFFPIFTNTYLGVSSTDEIYKRAALNLGANKKMFVTDILIPSALPNIFAGLKVGLGVGWMVVITAEMVGAQSGLGYMIQLNRIILEIPSVVVGMITIGMVGFVMNKFMVYLEKTLVPWKMI